MIQVEPSDCAPLPLSGVTEGGLLLNHISELLLRLPDPFALLSRSGETLEANLALQAIAQRRGAQPKLVDLFGPALTPILTQAATEGLARAHLAITVGPDPRPCFKVSVVADEAGELLAVLMTDVTEELSWRKQLWERSHDLTVLKDIGTALSGTIEMDTLSQRVHQQTARLTPAHNFYIALYDREAEMVMFPRYVEDGLWKEMTTRPFSNGLTEYVFRTGKPLILNRNVLETARARGIEPIGRPCRSWIGVPMVADRETIGMIALQDYEAYDRYGQHELEILSIIAGQAAASIKAARLLGSSRRAYEELSAAQAQLLEAARARGVTEAVGTLNHEVNNPLAAIAGNAQLLLRKSDSLTVDARAKIESMLESARRIQRVTGKMATLIQAASIPYPGSGNIVDVKRSVSSDELALERSFFPSSPEAPLD